LLPVNNLAETIKRAHPLTAHLLCGRCRMRYLIDDWRDWSARERLLAVVLALLPVGVPLAVWL
jgi:hypothetical protein